MNTVAHCEDSLDFLDELEGLRNAQIDWEIVIEVDRQAVGVALAKLEASVAAWDRVAQRLAELIAQHDGAAAS
jgi:hypothetical protein